MLGQPQGHRPVGVKIPEGQINDRSDKADLTVEHLLPIEFFAAQYVENGKIKQGLFCHSNGVFYMAPNGDQWLAGMRPLSEKLTTNVRHAYEAMKGAIPEDVPVTDTVDVIAGSMVEEAPVPIGNVDV